MEAEGFTTCDLAYLQQLASLEQMTDSEMMQQLRLSLLDLSAPTPFVEAILYAITPFTYVGHTHTDVVVAVSNAADGENILKGIFAEDVLILPYIMLGFVLARLVYPYTRKIDWPSIQGIFLIHHGLLTFHDDARQSYENMIALVARVESFLASKEIFQQQARVIYQPGKEDLEQLATMRKQISTLDNRAMLAALDHSDLATSFASAYQRYFERHDGVKQHPY